MRVSSVVLAVVLGGGALAVAVASGACSSAEESQGAPALDAGLDAHVEDVHAHDAAVDDDDASITGPTLLSQTGLYSDFASRTLSSDLLAFAPRFEFWSDGAQKARWLYLPPGTKIDTTRIDHWTFPVGTKAFKEFRAGGKLVETRLLMKVAEGTGNGVWWQAAYVWKEDGSDAVATLAGAANALGTSHTVPSQVDCRNCHGDVSDVLIGVSAIQLADPSAAPSALAALNAAGKLTAAPPPNIDVPGTGNVKDALAYLHANCGHCHNDEARRLDSQSRMRLRLLVGQQVEQTGAYTTTLGTVMRHTLENGVTDVVVKGDPDRSGLALRMARRDFYGMPPAGTKQVDDAGVATVRQWITEWQ